MFYEKFLSQFKNYCLFFDKIRIDNNTFLSFIKVSFLLVLISRSTFSYKEKKKVEKKLNPESIYTLLVTTAIPTIFSTGFISIFLNWKISSFQKKEDKSIEISIKLLENIFNKYDFNDYNDVYGKINKETTKKNLKSSFCEIRKTLENFEKTAVKSQLSAYIFELKEDSSRIKRNIKNLEAQLTNLKDEEKIYSKFYTESNKIVYEYDYFVARYNSAIRKYRKSVGSKATPEQNRIAQSNRILYTGMISLFLSFVFITLIIFVRKHFNFQPVEDLLIIFSMGCLLFCLLILIYGICDGIRYQIRTSTIIRKCIIAVRTKFSKWFLNLPTVMLVVRKIIEK